MEKAPRYIDSNPCDIDWNNMEVNETGDKRFCSSCSQLKSPHFSVVLESF